MNRRAAAAYGTLAALLFGSTSWAELDAAPLEMDACALLQSAEITATLGLPAEPGIRRDAGMESNGAYSSTCVWMVRFGGTEAASPNAPLGGRSFVILNAMQWPAGSGLARTFLEAFHTAAEAGEIPSRPEPRSFGDEALWWGDGLAVVSGDVGFGLSVFAPALEAEYPGFYEEQLAPKVVDRLDARSRSFDIDHAY